MTGLWIWCLPKHRLRRKCDMFKGGKVKACSIEQRLWGRTCLLGFVGAQDPRRGAVCCMRDVRALTGARDY